MKTILMLLLIVSFSSYAGEEDGTGGKSNESIHDSCNFQVKGEEDGTGGKSADESTETNDKEEIKKPLICKLLDFID